MQIVSSPMSAAVTNSIQEAYMSITCHWSHLKRMEWPMARRNSCTGRWPAAYSQQRLRRRFLWSNPTACLTTVTKWWDGSAPPDFAAGYFNPPTRWWSWCCSLKSWLVHIPQRRWEARQGVTYPLSDLTRYSVDVCLSEVAEEFNTDGGATDVSQCSPLDTPVTGRNANSSIISNFRRRDEAVCPLCSWRQTQGRILRHVDCVKW